MKTLTPYYLSFLFALSSTVGHAQVYIGEGTLTDEEVPVEPSYSYTYSQSIYLVDEIAVSGNVTGLTYSLVSAETNLSNSNEWIVYIGHTSKSSFANDSDWVPVDSLTRVFSGSPDVTDGVVTLRFTTPFFHEDDDANNLIIAVDENGPSEDDDSHDFYTTATTSKRSITYYADSEDPDPEDPPTPSDVQGTGGRLSSVPNIILQGIRSNRPSPPVDLVAVAGDRQAVLVWKEPSNKGGSAITNYQYSLDGGEYQSFSPPVTTGTTSTVTGLTNEITYQIALRAVNSNGLGVSSDLVTVRPDTILFVGGDGTADNPYQIATANQLNQVRDYPDKHFILTENINLRSSYGMGSGWIPIGKSIDEPFTGTFNGKGHTIDSLFIDRSGTSGLFGHTKQATIDSVGLINVEVTRGEDVGGLVGSDRSSTIKNSYVTGKVSGTRWVGGLVGKGSGTEVANSYATADVSGSGDDIGGFMGKNYLGTITDSYATGAVVGDKSVGGFVGESSGTITDSYATGAVTGNTSVGGFIGLHRGGTIANSYATGAVTGNISVGGFAGYDQSNTSINSYATTITNSYATGAVEGATSNVGGFIGRSKSGSSNSSRIIKNYATGKVGGAGEHKGGFIGFRDTANLGKFEHNYWDTQSSEIAQGVGNGADQKGIEGKTSAEMTLPSTFGEWSFVSTWNITPNSTYPWLRDNAQIPPPAPCADTAQLDTVSCESYRWRIGGRDSTYTASAKDTVRVTRADGCDSIYILHLTILSFDTATVVSGDNITVADNGTATYRWLDCGDDKSPIEGAMARVFTPGQNGNYAVAIAIDSGGVTCRDTSTCIPFSVTGIVENSFAHALRVYPNPTEGAVTIDLGAWQASVELTLTDASGRQVATQTYTKAEKINYPFLQPPGVYLMTLTSADKRARIRLVKQ